MSEIFSPAFVPATKQGPVASEGAATRTILIGIAVAVTAAVSVLAGNKGAEQLSHA